MFKIKTKSLSFKTKTKTQMFKVKNKTLSFKTKTHKAINQKHNSITDWLKNSLLML